VIDPYPDMLVSISNNQFPRGFSNSLPGVGHFNANGNQIIGKNLAEKLESLLK
jgi:lysophospholipase L1-like esterase